MGDCISSSDDRNDDKCSCNTDIGTLLPVQVCFHSGFIAGIVPEPPEHQDRGEQIDEGLQAVGNERSAAARKTGGKAPVFVDARPEAPTQSRVRRMRMETVEH